MRPIMLVFARHRIVSAELLACSFVAFVHTCAHAQDPATAKENGRIYVGTIHHVEQPVRADSAIIAIDPETGGWQIIIEKKGGGAGDDIRLSPDRRLLVFARFLDGIWKSESDGQFPFKIFDQDDRSYRGMLRPVWSPDSKRIIVNKGEYIKKRFQEEVWQSQSWQMDADGRNAVKVPIPDTEGVCDWSPDGQWFVTCSTREHGQLYLMRTDGTQERRLTEGTGNSSARFSPDGKKIVYMRRNRTEGSSIWTVDVDGTNAKNLVTEVDPSVPDGAFWSPDGKQIAVVLFDWQFKNGRKVSPNMTQGAHRIEIVDADGSNRRQIQLKGENLYFISPMGDWR
jgi:Tol biopolymer transport system component